MSDQIDEITKNKVLEGARVQQSIDRLRSIHNAALAAGIFHRREVAIAAVKAHLKGRGILVRD